MNKLENLEPKKWVCKTCGSENLGNICEDCGVKIGHDKSQEYKEMTDEEWAKKREELTKNYQTKQISSTTSETTKIKHCPECNTIITETDSVCLNCGYIVKENNFLKDKISNEQQVINLPPRQNLAEENEKESGFLVELIKEIRIKLEQALNNHFLEGGSSLNFNFTLPELPKNVTEEHLKAINELFGKKTFELSVFPKFEELHNIGEEYQRIMYPPKKRIDFKLKRKLFSFRRIIEKAKNENVRGINVTIIKDFDWDGDDYYSAFIYSVQEEIKELSKENISFVLLETTQKPNINKDKITSVMANYYGLKDGTSKSKDPLLEFFKDAFKGSGRRFNFSWNELNDIFIPKMEEKIKNIFLEKNIPIPNFKVTIMPAFFFNLQTTLFHPENSQTDSSEWTSTMLKSPKQKESPYRLTVGESNNGGASNISFYKQDSCHPSYDSCGVRFAIMFYA